MRISVIIPTYNRKEKLLAALDAYKEQTYKNFEIIVVDDGSTDGTEELLKKTLRSFELKYLRSVKKGPAGARNIGIKIAQSELIFFTGDDIIPDKNLLQEHLKIHQSSNKQNLAVLGYTSWLPEIKLTPFKKFLTNYHFSYDKISDKENVYWGYFYTSNVSLKKGFLQKSGFFDENFHYAAYEDTELAYRLFQQGMQLIYDDRALAWHNHEMNFRDYLKTMQKRGESAVYLAKKVPELERKASYRENNALTLRVFLKKIVLNNYSLPILANLICFLDAIYTPLPANFYKKIFD
jgi:GT2 family glycosyltransferase